MMGIKLRQFGPLDQVCLEDLVPKANFYRHVDRKLDFSFVRDLVKDCYAPIGRRSIDPVGWLRTHARREQARSEGTAPQPVPSERALVPACPSC